MVACYPIINILCIAEQVIIHFFTKFVILMKAKCMYVS